MTDNEVYKRALAKLTEAAWKFQKERDGVWLKGFEESTSIEKNFFRNQLYSGMQCKMTVEEFETLLPSFMNKNGNVDGSQFLLLFYRLRFEHKQKAMKEKLEREKQAKLAKLAEERAKKEEEDAKNAKKVTFEFSDKDMESALKKVTLAAVKYDKNMPGTVQLTAFEGAVMEPADFKDQLKRAFQLEVTPAELGALMKHFDKNFDGVVNCQEFLISFFRLGFEERAKRIKQERLELKLHQEARSKRIKDEAEYLAKKNAMKVR